MSPLYGSFELNEGLTGDSIAAIIDATLAEYHLHVHVHCSIKVREQEYDGASNMSGDTRVMQQ